MRSARYDNPVRLRALVEPAEEAPPAFPLPSRAPQSALAAPKLNSTALVQRQLEQIEQQAFDSTPSGKEAAQRTMRRALRQSAATLNTPVDSARRYHDLPTLDAPPEPPPTRAAPPRRQEPRWLAARALEPDLKALFVAEREPEILDTAVADADDVFRPSTRASCDSSGSWDFIGLAPFGAGVDARRAASIALGEQLPLA